MGDLFILKNESTKEKMGNLILCDRSIVQPDTFLSLTSLGLKLTHTLAFTFSESEKKKNRSYEIIEIVEQTWNHLQQFVESFEDQKSFTMLGIGNKRQLSS